MSFRQAILKLFYPLLIRFNKLTGRRNDVLKNERSVRPKESIYDYSIELNNGRRINLAELKGKKILLVNTASDCGYTQQYEQLQELFVMYRNNLEIIGFPANDFKQQEKGSDEDIAQFCKINFGVSFPLAKKSSVINGPAQNKIFRWLSHREQNGWCDHAPVWNFSKYLVNEEGILTHYFDPALSPLSEVILGALSLKIEN
jgi:glutathione peroxidase